MSCSDMDGCEVERDLRARLAAVEAERDQALNDCHHVPALAEAESRLAAVEALCDDLGGDIEHSRVNGDGPAEYREGWQHGVQFAADQVLAAARGEGDRG